MSARRLPVEALVWTGGLALMALVDPDGPHRQLCLFSYAGDWLGVAFCPGCGLGRSIGALARGEFGRSLALHPLGIPAVGMLLTRSVALVREAWRPPSRRLPPLR